MANDKAYVVICSNCEAYEDYHEWVNSVWTSREAAVGRIEGDLGMEQVRFADPAKPHIRDRWEKSVPFYGEPHPDENEDDIERDENGNPLPYWVDVTDARIEEFPLDGVRSD